MPAATVYCHIIDKDVTVVTDYDGNVTNVVCPEFKRTFFSCRLKDKEHGLFTSFFSKLSDVMADTKFSYCEFTGPNQNLL